MMTVRNQGFDLDSYPLLEANFKKHKMYDFLVFDVLAILRVHANFHAKILENPFTFHRNQDHKLSNQSWETKINPYIFIFHTVIHTKSLQ